MSCSFIADVVHVHTEHMHPVHTHQCKHILFVCISPSRVCSVFHRFLFHFIHFIFFISWIQCVWVCACSRHRHLHSFVCRWSIGTHNSLTHSLTHAVFKRILISSVQTNRWWKNRCARKSYTKRPCNEMMQPATSNHNHTKNSKKKFEQKMSERKLFKENDRNRNVSVLIWTGVCLHLVYFDGENDGMPRVLPQRTSRDEFNSLKYIFYSRNQICGTISL